MAQHWKLKEREDCHSQLCWDPRLPAGKVVKTSDQVTLSPKPPSSKMEVNFETLDFIVSGGPNKVTFKIPVFDDADLALPKDSERYQPDVLFLSAGNPEPKAKYVSKTN